MSGRDDQRLRLNPCPRTTFCANLMLVMVLMAFFANAASEVVDGVMWYYDTVTEGGKTCARVISGSVKYSGDLTIPGLTCTFREGTTLEELGTDRRPAASKVGDGTAWTPGISVKGGNSAFYSIGVGLGE